MKTTPDTPAPTTQKTTGLFLLILALVCAIAAQAVLLNSAFDQAIYWNVAEWFHHVGDNASPLAGLGLYLLAGILFILSLRILGTWELSPLTVFSGQRQSQPPRFGFWLTSAGLAAFIATYTAIPTKAAENGYALAFLWILSIGLFSFSVLRQSDWRPPTLRAVLTWIYYHYREILAVAGLLALGLLARTISLELHPYSMVNDEGELGKGALCILSGTCRNIFAIAWASQPLVAYLPYALSISILGHSAAIPVRMVSVLTGVLAILTTYLFTREAFGKKPAFVAGILLATFPFHLHFSRIGVNNITDSLTSSLMLWLLLRGIRKGTAEYFLAGGILAGLCFYLYPGSRLAAGLGVALILYMLLTRRGFLRAQIANLVVFAFAAALTAAPILGTYTVEGGEFNARMNSVGIFGNGVLQAEMRNSGMNAAQVLTRQFFLSSLPFITTPGPANFFNTPRAYFSPIAAIFLMLGLALVAWKMLDPRHIALLAWFFGPIVLGSALTAGPPSNQRMLGSSTAAVIIAALALMALLKGLQSSGPTLRRFAPLLLAAALLFNASQDIRFYFGEYRTGHYFEDLSNEVTYESHTPIAALGNTGRLYLIGGPMTYTVFGNFDYFSPTVEKMDLETITPESIAALPKDKAALFLAVPFREDDLRKIASWIPGGQWSAENRRNQPDQPLFFSYKVSEAQLQAFQP